MPKHKGGHPFFVKECDSLEKLKEILKHSKDEAYRVRVRTIIKVKMGKSRNTIALELSVSLCSVSNWVRKYNSEGLKGLETNRGGRPTGDLLWSAEIFDDLAKEIDKGGYWSIPRMQEWLKKHKGKEVPEQTVWYRMDKLKYSYKGARPHPVQGDKDKQEAFKKGDSSHTWSH